MLRRRFVSLAAALPAWWSSQFAFAGEGDAGANVGEPPANLESSTFGGLQYWADELIFHEYRIQRHASTGHYRLLNGDDHRLAWGTFDQCRTKLAEIRREQKLPPLPKRVVVTMHGIMRTRHSMGTVADVLRARIAAPVYQVGYASTRETIPQSAHAFDRLARQLRADGVEELDVVAFSMGNLVVRHWLGDVAADAAEKGSAAALRPTLRRWVMLGPPNNGAQRAHLWAGSTMGRELFRFVMGDAGEQLGPRFGEIQQRLLVPDCEFGIVAGGKGDDAGWHPQVPGDDDGTVAVSEAQLPGATDFLVVPVRHTWLISDRRATTPAASFIEHGYFTSASTRNPLAR